MRDPFTAQHWNGLITLIVRNPQRGAPVSAVEQISQTLLGRLPLGSEWAGLAGAPDGSEVRLVPARLDHGDEVAIEVRHPWIEDYALRRVLQVDSATVLRNEFLTVVRSERMKGVGTRMLAMQVRTASSLGVVRLEADADGRPHSQRNGYYTWARLGFNGSIPAATRAVLPPALHDALDINALMLRPGGAEWWREHGSAFRATFDLAPLSRSRQVLEGYTAEKGIRV